MAVLDSTTLAWPETAEFLAASTAQADAWDRHLEVPYGSREWTAARKALDAANIRVQHAQADLDARRARNITAHRP